MKEETKKLVLSASKVKTFKQCPRKFYYNYIEKLPKKQWDHFDLGIFVHSVLERFHEGFREDGQIDNIKKLMTKSFAFEKDKLETENKGLSREILLSAKEMLLDYLYKIENEGLNTKILSLEEEFKIKLNEDFSLIGFIDRIDLDLDGIYHIADYKTSKSSKYMDDFQLRVYGMHLLEEFPEVDFFRGSYIMLKLQSKLVSYKFNKIDIEKEKQKLIEIADIISKEKKWKTNQTKLCDWCDFRDVCFNSW